MNFLNILKRPFQYDEDIEKQNLVESLITSGIILGIFMFTNVATILLSVSKAGSAMSSLIGGGNSYTSAFGGFGGEMIKSISGKVGFTIAYSSVVGFLIALGAIVLFIYFIRRMNNKEYTFIESLSFVSSSLVLPVSIMPVMLLGVLLFNKLGFYIIGATIIASFMIMIINLYEGLKSTDAIGNGRIIYLVSISTTLYYMLSIYVTIRVFAAGIVSAITRF